MDPSHRPSDAGNPGGITHGDKDHDPAGDLRFARVLFALGLAVLLLAALLIALPYALEGPPIVYLIAYGIGTLFGPIGFTLLASAWRMRNRALHGTTLPPSQRLGLRILGGILMLIGLSVALNGLGAQGAVSFWLGLVWGLSLGAWGLRLVVRSFLTDRDT